MKILLRSLSGIIFSHFACSSDFSLAVLERSDVTDVFSVFLEVKEAEGEIVVQLDFER